MPWNCPMSLIRAAEAGDAQPRQTASRARRAGKKGCRVTGSVLAGSASEGADDVEEALQPALPAGAGDLALADVADIGVGNARRGDAVVGADVDRAHDARNLQPFVAAVEGDQFLALHQHRAVRIDFGDRHADFARELVRLRRLALSRKFIAAAHPDVSGAEEGKRTDRKKRGEGKR